jgi:hypothetical protein
MPVTYVVGNNSTGSRGGLWWAIEGKSLQSRGGRGGGGKGKVSIGTI